MVATFDIDLNKLKDGDILYYSDRKLVSISKEKLLKDELKDLEKMKVENANLKRVVEEQNLKIKTLEEKFKKVMEVFTK